MGPRSLDKQQRTPQYVYRRKDTRLESKNGYLSSTKETR